MLYKFASGALAIVLVGAVGSASVMAQTPAKTEKTTDVAETPSAPVMATDKITGKEAQANEKLKAGLARLVADTKAGKVKLSAQPQSQPAKRHFLSKRTKIAIGVGAAVVVVAAIVVIHVRNHMFDDLNFNHIAIH